MIYKTYQLFPFIDLSYHINMTATTGFKKQSKYNQCTQCLGKVLSSRYTQRTEEEFGVVWDSHHKL